jgi:hypothetical protein
VTDSELTAFLISRGLACLGTEETIEDLRKRFGMRSWFGFQDITELPPATLFKEQTEPFFIRDDNTCLVPPSAFECDFNYDRDSERTYRRAFDRLTAIFGSSTEGTAVDLLASWKFERMSLTIHRHNRSMSEEMFGPNLLYEKHPELWDFCRISIYRNWVRPLMHEEMGPADAIGVDNFYSPDDFTRGITMWERGLFRLAASGDTLPHVWRRDEIFGWWAGRWSAAFKRGPSVKLQLDRAEAVKAAGYSRLSILLPNPFSFQHEPVKTVLLASKTPNGLDAEAQKIAAFWGLPMDTDDFGAY